MTDTKLSICHELMNKLFLFGTMGLNCCIAQSANIEFTKKINIKILLCSFKTRKQNAKVVYGGEALQSKSWKSEKNFISLRE